LVRFLEKAIPARHEEIEKPIYLNSVSHELADAAVEAVRNESIRLYDFAVDIIHDGLSISREAYRTEEKVKRVVKKSTTVIDEDIDERYERQVKALYGSIVEFVINTKGGYSGGRLKEELNLLRHAGQNLVDAVKGVKHLKKNLVKFMQQDNRFVRKKYDLLRRLIVTVTKAIDAHRASTDPSGDILDLDQLKLHIEVKLDNISNGLDNLIRNHQIDIQMATSLMNDITYCREVCWALIAAGSVLFAGADHVENAAMRSIALDEREISEILDNRNQGAVP